MTLLPHHQRMLTAESGISPKVIAARGYFSTESKAELRRLGFTTSQQLTPTLVIPVWSCLTGEKALYHHRPDEPRMREGRPAKYEFAAGSRMAVDVHPFLRERVRAPSVPLFVTEGIRKGDAAVSRGLCCIALLGVWTWRGRNEAGGSSALPDWEGIVLKDRQVYLVFDSDVMLKPQVHQALVRLSAFLTGRGANVAFVYLPHGEDGQKTGLDDFLAANHSTDDLLALSTPVLRALPDDAETAPRLPYRETSQGLVWCKPTQNGPVDVPLTNFTVRILTDVVEDDGVETRRTFEIEARCNGRRSHFTLPAASFAPMNWPVEHLGAGAIVYPGMGTKDHARVAIQALSGDPPTRRVYGHTGWRETEPGQYAYLHMGGAIGTEEEVQVHLPPALEAFHLPPPGTRDESAEALRASLRLLDLAPDPVSFPLSCGTFRAVLGDTDFAGHLVGRSGEFKSELAALQQQHFGRRMDARHLPGSWSSTENALEALAFAAKDALVVADDFAPTGTTQEVARLHSKADRLLRGQGNGAGRMRMRADTTLRPVKASRAYILSTGEDTPQGVSLRGRMCILDIVPGSVDPASLSACQRDAASGLYAQAMAGYLAWLAPQYAEVRRGLPEDVCQLRDQAARSGMHRRTPEITANLSVGLRHLLRYAVEVGALDEAAARALWERGWAALGAAAQAQGTHQAASEPTLRYLELLSAALTSGKAHVAGVDGDVPEDPALWGWRKAHVGTGEWQHDEWRPQGDRVGWVDWEDLYLQPDAAFHVVKRLGGESGDGISLGSKTLHKRLKERGLLASTEEGHGTLLVRKMIAGTRQTVLHLHSRSVVTIKSAQSAQPAREEDGAAESEENAEPNGQIPWADFSEGRGKSAQEIRPEHSVPHLAGNGEGQDGQIGRIIQTGDVRMVEVVI